MNKRELQRHLEDKDLNGNKYIPINNCFKCQWTKFSNKKTQRVTTDYIIKQSQICYCQGSSSPVQEVVSSGFRNRRAGLSAASNLLWNTAQIMCLPAKHN